MLLGIFVVGEDATYDMMHGMLIKELTQPKETEIPQRRVAPTMRSESALSPVVKESTAP